VASGTLLECVDAFKPEVHPWDGNPMANSPTGRLEYKMDDKLTYGCMSIQNTSQKVLFVEPKLPRQARSNGANGTF